VNASEAPIPFSGSAAESDHIPRRASN